MCNQASKKLLLTYKLGCHKIVVFRKLLVYMFAKVEDNFSKKYSKYFFIENIPTFKAS